MAQATLTRRELIRFAAVAGAVAACTPVSSPAPGPSQTAAEKKPHGTVNIGSDLSGFDLQPNNFLTISMVGTSLFDGLTASGPKGVIQPRLATAWKALDDKNTWEFTLREGVTFSNGERFDAQSVKFTVEKTLNDKLRWAGRLATIKSVTIINDYTVQVTTDGPDALLPGRLSLYMMPPKQVAAEGLNTFGLHPAGTGSYVIDSYTASQKLTMQYRSDSWRVGKVGVPDKPLVIDLPSSMPNPATRIAALRSGSVDAITAVPIDEIEALQRDGFTVSIGKQASPVTFFLLTDLDKTNPATVPLHDKRVRQALNHAVDQNALINQLFKGLVGDCPGQLVDSDGFGYNPNIKAFGYDPAKAKQLLAEAGYPNGFSTQITVLAGNPMGGEVIGQALAQYFDKVGVKAEILPTDGAQWISKWDGGGRSPLFLGLVNYLPFYDADFTYSWFWSKNQPAPARFYSNPEFDRIFEAQRQELDRAKRDR